MLLKGMSNNVVTWECLRLLILPEFAQNGMEMPKIFAGMFAVLSPSTNSAS